MIAITEAARRELRQRCRVANGRQPVVQRLVAGQYGRLQFVDDGEGDFTGDIIIEDDKGKLLVLDEELHDSIIDLILDVEEHQGATVLCFRPSHGADPTPE